MPSRSAAIMATKLLSPSSRRKVMSLYSHLLLSKDISFASFRRRKERMDAIQAITLQTVGASEKPLLGSWQKVCVCFACAMPNLPQCIHASSTKIDTYTLFTLRITEFMQAVITPVADGEYGAGRVCDNEDVCLCVSGTCLLLVWVCGMASWISDHNKSRHGLQ